MECSKQKYQKKSIFEIRKALILIITICSFAIICGCGKSKTDSSGESNKEATGDIADNGEAGENSTDIIAGVEESARDSHIDFVTLKSQNNEIFAWLQVPGTNIDCAVAQNMDDNDFYRHHNYKKEQDDLGAAFIELPVMNDMCDFNTVIHGNGNDGIFRELVNFLNPSFFEKNREFYIYLPDNQLTYTVAAAFERDNTSLIRDFSFAEAKGDREFLDYVINERIPGKQVCEGWEDFDEYNFFTTLTIDEPDSDKQLVVIGVLTFDAAGTINRDVIEEFDLGPDLLAQ